MCVDFSIHFYHVQVRSGLVDFARHPKLLDAVGYAYVLFHLFSLKTNTVALSFRMFLAEIIHRECIFYATGVTRCALCSNHATRRLTQPTARTICRVVLGRKASKRAFHPARVICAKVQHQLEFTRTVLHL